MAKQKQSRQIADLASCKSEVERMLRNSQTKLIMPVVTLGLLNVYRKTGQTIYGDAAVQNAYESAVRELIGFLGHDVHLGAKYYDAYASRMSRYAVLKPIAHLEYRLENAYCTHAQALIAWIPKRIQEHIESKLGIVPSLHDATIRLEISSDKLRFIALIDSHIVKSPANFEIFSFAVLKVHLERFACRIYRDTRTASHDGGVDLSTNFGVVYQIKKLQIFNQVEAKKLYAELKSNFDHQRLQDGNVIVVIDDVSKEVRDYLIEMRVQSISRSEVLKLAANFDDPEDRQKVLRVVYEEFRREYSNRVELGGA